MSPSCRRTFDQMKPFLKTLRLLSDVLVKTHVNRAVIVNVDHSPPNFKTRFCTYKAAHND